MALRSAAAPAQLPRRLLSCTWRHACGSCFTVGIATWVAGLPMPPGLHAAVLLLLLAIPLAAAQRTVPAASVAAVAAAARAGEGLTISGLTLDGEAQPSSLNLQPLEVWDSDARVVVHGAGGPEEQAPPSTRLYRGSIAGKPQSTVLLMVGEQGIGGLANDGSNVWALGTDSPAASGPSVAAAAAGTSGGLSSYRARKAAGPMAAAASAARPTGRRRCANGHGKGRPNGRSLLHAHDEAHVHGHGPEDGLPNMSDALHSIPSAMRKLAQVRGTRPMSSMGSRWLHLQACDCADCLHRWLPRLPARGHACVLMSCLPPAPPRSPGFHCAGLAQARDACHRHRRRVLCQVPQQQGGHGLCGPAGRL